jgi:hypothetical protein
MKYLKFFESFGESYYKQIHTADFFRVKNHRLSENELDVLYGIAHKKGGIIKRDNDMMITFQIPKDKKTVTMIEYTNVKKDDDEYFYVAFDIMNRKEFYKADQFDGLLKLLDDIL